MIGDCILFMDFYQFIMLQVYFDQGMNEVVVFEFFVCKLLEWCNFFVVVGLEQVFDFFEQVWFIEEEFEWLIGCGCFYLCFIDLLVVWCFIGDVDVMLEGMLFFLDEFILCVVVFLWEV